MPMLRKFPLTCTYTRHALFHWANKIIKVKWSSLNCTNTAYSQYSDYQYKLKLPTQWMQPIQYDNKDLFKKELSLYRIGHLKPSSEFFSLAKWSFLKITFLNTLPKWYQYTKKDMKPCTSQPTWPHMHYWQYYTY